MKYFLSITLVFVFILAINAQNRVNCDDCQKFYDTYMKITAEKTLIDGFQEYKKVDDATKKNNDIIKVHILARLTKLANKSYFNTPQPLGLAEMMMCSKTQFCLLMDMLTDFEKQRFCYEEDFAADKKEDVNAIKNIVKNMEIDFFTKLAYTFEEVYTWKINTARTSPYKNAKQYLALLKTIIYKDEYVTGYFTTQNNPRQAICNKVLQQTLYTYMEQKVIAGAATTTQDLVGNGANLNSNIDVVPRWPYQSYQNEDVDLRDQSRLSTVYVPAPDPAPPTLANAYTAFATLGTADRQANVMRFKRERIYDTGTGLIEGKKLNTHKKHKKHRN